MDTIARIDLEIESLKVEREKYNHDAENAEIESLNNRLNMILSLRNDKKSLYDKFDKDIKELQQVLTVIKSLEEEK